MSLTEILILFANSFAYLLIVAIFLAVFYKLWFHISPLVAFPVYAALILLELLVSGFGKKTSPYWMSFNRPESPHSQMFMDFIAFISLVLGYILFINIGVPHEPESMIKLLKGELLPQPLVWLFIGSSLIVYIISFMSKTDRTHPINKMKSLGMPQVLKEYFKIDT